MTSFGMGLKPGKAASPKKSADRKPAKLAEKPGKSPIPSGDRRSPSSARRR